jgi:hypothetical protein
VNIPWVFPYERPAPVDPRMHQHSPLLVPARPRGQACFFHWAAYTHSAVSAIWVSTLRCVHPRGVSHAEGGRWPYSHNVHAAPGTSGIGGSPGDASRVILVISHDSNKTCLMGHGKWPQRHIYSSATLGLGVQLHIYHL